MTVAPSDPMRRTLRMTQPAPQGPRRGTWVAIVDGAARPLAPGVPCTVGAGSQADLQVHCRHASRLHCVVRVEGGDVWVEDNGSTNGVWIQGQRIERARLDRHSTFTVGRKQILLARHFGWRVPDALAWEGMIARDPASLHLWSRLAAAAASDAPVWLHGETGSGKERAARALHAASPRRAAGPWVALNCAALPAELAEAELFGVTRGAFTGAHRTRSGAFARADGGTLLLDEVGELPLPIQAKLLRVLETGEVQPIGADRAQKVDVRVVAATWRDLEEAAREGTFREDLLHRLWVLKLTVPPLRARRRDVAPLLDLLLVEAGAPHLFPDRGALAAIEGGHWAGNVRQLRNQVRRAVTADDPRLLLPDGPPRATATRCLQRTLGVDAALRVVRQTLEELGGNRTATAKALGVSRSTLYRWLASAT
ncbi:MAG: Fis family transcriptional regulator [Deltaproteobacteria bacterium HGW-Deltaproteobacteria-14]|jgi:DNA-binding NtrC family response regulator|nr:MAG: Fis family transcriptional regulator [Deltaproteobacteria bacterium HGW-Deltaproteobacteria-14]